MDSNRLRVVHAVPQESPAHRLVLDAAMRRGPVLFDGAASATGPTLPSDAPPCWLAVPLVARSMVTGAVALGARPGGFARADLPLLEAYAAQAALALESGLILDQVDSGRRSWADMVDAIPLALCVTDSSGRVRRANRAFADLVHASAAGVVGRPWLALVPPSWGEGVQAALAAAGSGREVELRAHNRVFAVSAFAAGDGRQSLTVLLFDDRTERRRLQDQLVQSEKMSAIGQLVAGVAHDLNNPLASVLGFADFLVEASDIPDNLREPVRVVQQQALRAAAIVRNLLDFARKQEHRHRNMSLRPLLDATLTLLRNQLMADRVETRLELEPDIPQLDVDTNQIQQVFVNLIQNACQAIASTGRPGEIRIRARCWRDGVAVDVSDNGPGMPPELAARAMEPFFTTKPEGSGTGLGLTICQGILKEHGGRLTLTTAPGEGTTFTVELPASSRAEDQPAPALPTAPPTEPMRILLVDDEPHILHYLRTTLEAWGHRVALASDGAAALEVLERETFDLVISDLRMPRMNGQAFYRDLASKNPAMAARTLFSTGDTVRGDTLRFLEELERPWLNKPFSLAELRAALGWRPGAGRA